MHKQVSGLDATPTIGRAPETHTRVIAVSSGKGGVGKTNVVASWAVALGRMGRRVLVLDADLGLGNLDVLLGLVPCRTIEHALSGVCTLKEICLQGPAGIQVLPASSGVPHLTSLTDSQQVVIQEQLEELATGMDVLLIDTGAGISPNVTFFASSAHEIVIVVTPEPTSLTDAYALIKVLTQRYRERRFKVLVNLAKGPREAAEVFRKLDAAVDRFLHAIVEPIGYVPQDDYVPLAVMRQKAVADLFPDAPASQAFARLARQVLQWPLPTLPKSSVQLLWQKMIRLA
ncbi:MAG: MinD/ParA family protein [Nitrospira sp.]|nr:MinD/ParA family protein [Nitrospira sp.]MCP9463253.1 MinD/ParA family protein [Nitrospira sp.]